jgi:hypothetical protein
LSRFSHTGAPPFTVGLAVHNFTKTAEHEARFLLRDGNGTQEAQKAQEMQFYSFLLAPFVL